MIADDQAADLRGFLDASPTPYHAVREAVRRLEPLGVRMLDEREEWRLGAGDRVYVVRGETSIIALELGSEPPEESGFRLLGAHTDSPNLRLKPSPELARSGYLQLGVEVYGGVLLSTWLDRDLSMAGRIVVRAAPRPVAHLVDFRRALMRVPNLAIHLNRAVNTEGLVLNAQQHMAPVCGLELGGPLELKKLLAAEIARESGCAAPDPNDILSWDLCLYDAQPAATAGLRDELMLAGRLDNLASCHAGLRALAATTGARPATRGVVLYDHEEVGSRSAQGAASPFLRQTLERVVAARGPAGADRAPRAYARSFVVSADMAHAVHPNYADKHEPAHTPVLGGGPVIKTNVSQSYATDGESSARFETMCLAAGVTPQRFVTRTDLPCGSTIGPITAGELGIRTVDVGNPMLAMHSAREMSATSDVGKMIDVLGVFFAGDG